MTLYEEVGGEALFRALVDGFYEGVAEDPVLRPLYPEGDLEPAKERLRLFFVQYWGGPTTYSEQRGHPRLRMRHAPFAVNPQAKDHWLRHFRDALDSVELTPEQDEKFCDWLAERITETGTPCPTRSVADGSRYFSEGREGEHPSGLDVW